MRSKRIKIHLMKSKESISTGYRADREFRPATYMWNIDPPQKREFVSPASSLSYYLVPPYTPLCPLAMTSTSSVERRFPLFCTFLSSLPPHSLSCLLPSPSLSSTSQLPKAPNPRPFLQSWSLLTSLKQRNAAATAWAPFPPFPIRQGKDAPSPEPGYQTNRPPATRSSPTPHYLPFYLSGR